MAKTATEKKKKKNIVQRMVFGNENKPDLTPEHMQMSKWQAFKYLFFHRFGTMVALNMLTCLFAVPAILVIILFYLNVTVNSGLVPYSANLGLGYPVVVDAVHQGIMMNFTYSVMKYASLVPCIAVFALGVAGNLYVMRKLIWEQPTRTFRDFFIGIKKCWLGAILMGLAFGLTLLLFMFSLGYFDAYGLSVSLKVITVILASILLVFISMFTVFFMTQNAAFKMRPLVLIRNSSLFVIGTHIMSVIFIGIGIAPAFLAFIPGITMLLSILYFFIGFSYSTLVLSLYSHYCYEKFLYDKIDVATPVYAKRASDVSADSDDAPVKQKKQAPVPYKNPKKRKKSIDEGSSITPLAPMFRREDLERLEKEHEQILTESNSDGGDELGDIDKADVLPEKAPTDKVDSTETVNQDGEADGTNQADGGKE